MKDKTSTLMKLVGVILVIAIVVLCILVIIKKKQVEYIDKMMEEKYGTGTKEEPETTSKEELSIDLTNSINTKKITYKKASLYPSMDYGLSVSSNNTQNITITIDWNKLSPILKELRDDDYPSMTKTYQSSSFNKNVKKVFIGEINHKKSGLAVFFLMEDNTIQYWKLMQQTLLEDASIQYEKNFNETDTTLELLNVKEIPEVVDVVEFYNVENSNNQLTTLGFKMNGSFYDLGYEINK